MRTPLRTPLRTSLTALAVASLIAATPGTDLGHGSVDVVGPVDDAVAALPVDACDDLDGARCLFPFPNDHFTTKADTATGKRVDLHPLAMPRNTAGKPIDPTEWNRNDGFSPGSMLLTFVPGLDLQRTWGLPDGVAQLDRPALSLSKDAPIVIVDADSGERHPFWSELDEHPATGDDERALIIRPLVNFEEGHRYIVALRDLKDGDGDDIAAGETFAAFRDAASNAHTNGKCKPNKAEPADAEPGSRAAHFEDIFLRLCAADVPRDDLYLAWDFTIASAGNLAGRALHIRDDAFAQLGDDDLSDRVVEGVSPAFTVDSVDEMGDGDATWRRIHGHVTVPNYLDRGQDETRTPAVDDPTDELEDLPSLMVPLSRFNYDTPAPGPNDLPTQNPVAPTLEASFVCNIPSTATPGDPATPTLYGHGLLGGKRETNGSSTARLRERNHAMCGVDWSGMATEDIGTVALLLADQSSFASLPDRAQQGFLDFMFVGRALIHPDGLTTDPAFQFDGGEPVLDLDQLVYDGNSQGGIMGGALTALSPDITRSTLGVVGANYSTLLNRSVDWEGAYGDISYAFYPDKLDQQLMFALLQMLWDRGETNGYAHHLTDDPYPNTPPHQVLMHVAYGDYQVANVSAEVAARTAGMPLLQTSMPTARHWSDDAAFGFATFPVDGEGALIGQPSALVYWDSGNPTPPSANVPPADLGHDPHSDPRKSQLGGDQRRTFYLTGLVEDVFHGGAYLSDAFPHRCPTDGHEQGSPCPTS